MRNGDLPDPEGTDRRAVVEGRVSVSPLTAPHTTMHHDALDALAASYRD
jgi:5'-nucleotidase